MSAANYNLNIDQGADFTLTLTLSDNTGTSTNLTGYTFAADIKKNVTDADPPLAMFTFTILDQTLFTGQVVMSMTKATIDAIILAPENFPNRIPEQYCYDVFMTNLSGFTTRLIQGLCLISPAVTI